jgi:hypothetical protein
MPKLAKPLSDAQVKRAKVEAKLVKLFDGHGLYLEIQPTGGKFWRFRYRQPNGKETTITFGPYPEVSLAAARDKRTEARHWLLEGSDPGQQRDQGRRDSARASENTFRKIATEWHELKQTSWTPAYSQNVLHDGVIHCRSLARAKFVLAKIDERFRQCGLELHPEKTRIVYCKDVNRAGDYPCVQFTFLGYTFRPRKAVDKYGRVYVNFAPSVSRDALKAMRQTIRGWHLQLKCDKSLADLSAMFNPILRGWRQYYGRFYESAMSPVWRHVNG